jgi:hypothetical protein
LKHKTEIYNLKTLLNVVSDKTVFIKFKIINNVTQNIDETH